MESHAQRSAESVESWVPTSAMTDEQLLVLTKRYVNRPKPFPNWIVVGDQLHVALKRRGLLHD